ncbi:Fis family transcriptional regulator (fragment) [Burkholderia sp. 8Y]
MCLAIHLALAACRREGSGAAYQFNELLRVFYMTLFLQENGFGALPLKLYARAEKNLNARLSRGKHGDHWFIDAETPTVFEKVLQLHDEQLRRITYRDLAFARERIEGFIRSARVSPLGDDVRLAIRESQANSSETS